MRFSSIENIVVGYQYYRTRQGIDTIKLASILLPSIIGIIVTSYKSQVHIKLGPHDVWYVFVMRDASWFGHHVYEEMCVIWVNVSFVHSSHLVRQVGGKLTHMKANGSQISVICYLVLMIIYRNTSNIGIWRVREWIWVWFNVQIFNFFFKKFLLILEHFERKR